MRCFDRHRRRLIKRHYTFGTIKSASGTSKVEIQDSEGLPFEKIEITGSTQQDKFEGNVDEIVSLSAYEANIEDGVAGAYSNILRSAELITFPDGVESANIFLEEVSSLLEVVPEYITILSVNEALNSFKVLYSMNQIFESTETEPFYIAIADETGNNSNNNTYYSALINNCNLVIRHHLESTVPTPETPITIENANNEGINLFDRTKVTEGVQLHASGAEVTDTNYFTSDYIEIEPNTKYSSYTFAEMPTSSAHIVYRIAWYDENKAFISMGLDFSQARLRGKSFTGTSPTNAKFVRLSTNITSKYLMFNKGDFAQYKAYNSNLSVKVHSNNLLKLVDGEFVVGGITFTIKNGIITLNGIIEGTGVYAAGFGFEPVFLQPSETYILRLQKYTNNKSWISGADTNIGYASGGGIAYTSPTNGNVLETIYVYINRGEQYDNFSFAPALYLEGTETAYEKPFSDTVEIPTNIDVDGTNVPLRFSKHDKLLVDRINNKVVYTEGSYYHVFNGKEYMTFQGTYKFFIFPIGGLFGIAPIWSNTTNAYCNYLKVGSYFTMTDLNGFSCVQNERYIGFWTDRETSLADFKEWLTQLYNDGKPLIVVVKRVTPVEHDITNTDLGKALLVLRLPRGQDGMLCVNSNIEVSKLDVSYYSLEDEDKVLLTVCYVNNEGEEIKGTSSYDVRKGSKYQVIAPHIDGYKCQFNELYGVAEEDTTVVLTYEEATEDVSI